MSWSVGDEITAAKLNSENIIANWSFSWTAPNNSNDDHSIGNALFYYHDCGGINDPLLISWQASTTTEWYWFGNYSPWITMWIEKRTATGVIIGNRYAIISAEHATISLSGNLKKSDLTSLFGSSEGWYYLYYDCRDDQHGSASMDFSSYMYPNSNGENKALRYYIDPTSSGFIPGIELTAANLNTHNVGTY